MIRLFSHYGSRKQKASWARAGDHTAVASGSEWHLRIDLKKGLDADP